MWALACGWQTRTSKARVWSRVHKINRKNTNPLTPTNPIPDKGVGYGGDVYDAFSFPHLSAKFLALRPIPRAPIDTQGNLIHEAYLRLLAQLLPSSKEDTTYDTSPPDFLSHMLSRSPLIEEVASLLNNDSIEDISHQYEINDAALDLFDALGSYNVTAGLVYDDRNLYHAKGGTLLSVSFESGKSKNKIYSNDTGRPLIMLLEKLAAQSQTVLHYSQGHPDEFKNEEGQNLLKFCRRSGEMAGQHTANMQRLRTTVDPNDDKPIQDWSKWHREKCLGEIPDEMITSNFSLSREAARFNEPILGRMKRLITEISMLQASLPDGIYIRHGSSRLDMMKVLIIAPRGTPYEHGLFEFDLYCDVDYPKSPPKLRFRTTNRGALRFNPNLYEDGKGE